MRFIVLFFLCFLVVASSHKRLPRRCSQEADSGRCRARFERYFFNTTTRECELFIYGGCEGNRNNFEDINKCKKMIKQWNKERGTCTFIMS